MVTNKTCKGCDVEKELEDFHVANSKTGRRHNLCKICRSIRKPREWDNGTRTCVSCSVNKSAEQFPLTASGNPRKVCKECRYRFESYGLTAEKVLAMKEAQEGLCAICPASLEELFAVDHDHACCSGRKTCGNCVRGLLCIQCNTRLQWFEEYKKQAEKYLERYNEQSMG